jgi:hypothetical protein
VAKAAKSSTSFSHRAPGLLPSTLRKMAKTKRSHHALAF